LIALGAINRLLGATVGRAARLRGMRLALTLLTLLLFAPGADAAWSGQDLSGPHGFVDPSGVVVSRDGGALAAWGFQDGEGNSGHAGYEGAARRPDASTFDDTRTTLVRRQPILHQRSEAAGLASYGRNGALLALRLVSADGMRSGLGVRFGHTTGSFGPVRTLRRVAFRIAGASLAANARGDAALAWFEDRGTRTDRVYVALRRAGHGFGKPRQVATGRIRDVAAAIGARGDVLVSWDARGVLRTRFKPRSRAGFLATDTIRSEPAFFAEMHPVVAPSGRAVLAWSAQFASEGGDRGPVFYQAATRHAGDRRFARARLLETIPASSAGGDAHSIDAVVDSTGAVAIAWSGAAGVRASRGGGPPQTLSAPGATAVLSDVAAGPDGRLIAVWDGGVDDPASVVRAAIADGPGTQFGAPEDVSPAGRDSRFGHAAFLGERPAIVLSGRPAGGGESVAQAYVR